MAVDLAAARRRPLLRTCLDWTERRHHLGDALAASWCAQLLDRGWLVRGGHPRAVRLTVEGTAGLAELLASQVFGLALTRYVLHVGGVEQDGKGVARDGEHRTPGMCDPRPDA